MIHLDRYRPAAEVERPQRGVAALVEVHLEMAVERREEYGPEMIFRAADRDAVVGQPAVALDLADATDRHSSLERAGAQRRRPEGAGGEQRRAGGVRPGAGAIGCPRAHPHPVGRVVGQPGDRLRGRRAGRPRRRGSPPPRRSPHPRRWPPRCRSPRPRPSSGPRCSARRSPPAVTSSPLTLRETAVQDRFSVPLPGVAVRPAGAGRAVGVPDPSKAAPAHELTAPAADRHQPDVVGDAVGDLVHGPVGRRSHPELAGHRGAARPPVEERARIVGVPGIRRVVRPLPEQLEPRRLPVAPVGVARPAQPQPAVAHRQGHRRGRRRRAGRGPRRASRRLCRRRYGCAPARGRSRPWSGP